MSRQEGLGFCSFFFLIYYFSALPVYASVALALSGVILVVVAAAAFIYR